jgi:hypothetical protein
MVTNTRQTREISALKRALGEVETRLAERDSTSREQMERIAARLDEHEARLNEVPSTGQIVAAMDELLSKTMQSLNQIFQRRRSRSNC